MNIQELDSYDLGDAVKFHDRLNPRLWDRKENLLPQVREKLLDIASDFQEFLGVNDLDIKDITVSGSNAAYSYTPASDIDLHLVVNMPEANSDIYQELFNAKKYQYNDEHDIRIGGADVELYVQPADQAHHSQGIYSLLNNQWIQVPKRHRAKIDDHCVQHKTEDLSQRIQQALTSHDQEIMQKLWDKIKTMRQSGLETQGEFGCDNLVFKMLRRSGLIDQLKKAKTVAHDQALSLQERRKKRSRVRYSGYWAPGFSFAGSDNSGGGDGGGGESMSESPDGVSAGTKMFLEGSSEIKDQVRDFVEFALAHLGIDQAPRIVLNHDPLWTKDQHSFGKFDLDQAKLTVSVANRHVMDVFRTLAHELVHYKQYLLGPVPTNAGATGSKHEDQANALAGRLMREYGELHPEYFENGTMVESSGYIPTQSQKHDPRFQMALSVDVRPGALGLNANKLNLDTDSQGRPSLLAPNAANILKEHWAQDLFELLENGAGQEDERFGNQEPTGPEFPPRFPAGTTKIDVSDTYDWYKLGQVISDLDDADPGQFGKGPPQTVIVFPSDEMEQPYLKQFKRLGMPTHDIDEDQQLDELKIDNSQGIGAVPYNADVDYFGLRVQMTPSMFLKLSLPLDLRDTEEKKAINYISQHLDNPGIGAPFLEIAVPESWTNGNFSKLAQVRNHDGRHRCHAVLETQGNAPIEVHLFLRGGYNRRQYITDQIIDALNRGLVSQRGNTVVGPIFSQAQ